MRGSARRAARVLPQEVFDPSASGDPGGGTAEPGDSGTEGAPDGSDAV
ncbi:hypothetical protein ACIHFC_25535 [Streptomyces sp. NPDC052013]